MAHDADARPAAPAAESAASLSAAARAKAATSPPNVLGDLVLAWGAGAASFIGSLTGGFSILTTTLGTEHVHAAVRGAVQTGRSEDGTRFLAISDLIEGRLEQGTRALERGTTPPQRDWRGRFAQVLIHPKEQTIVALTDHYASLPLYVLERHDSESNVFAIATDLRLLASSPWCRREIDLVSVYHYLNFACIPAPRTIMRDIRRLEPSTRIIHHCGTTGNGNGTGASKHTAAGTQEDRFFVAEYPEDLRGSDRALASQLRERVVATVKEYRPHVTSGWGCFLSGGTDSSAIVSILARDTKSQTKQDRVKSFSIGFAEAGYDELEFARLAAEACGADPSTASVSREQAQALATRVVDEYDQPFANASAIPTIACADLAHEHDITMLLAGDGGDEIFGGNERYAKDKVMETFYALPKPIKAVGQVVGKAMGSSPLPLPSRARHFLNRVENFVERASIPNPDRFYTDDSFASDHYEELLTPELRSHVERDASLDFMRALYALGSQGGPLHRVMRLDLHMAIAQNDIPKVHGATRSAGVSTRFPFLDPSLLAFTARLSERHKVRGLKKRYLFKRAMKGILPDQILKKKKQGFGLPIAVWLRNDRAFQDTVRDVLFDKRAAARGWWQASFVEGLLDEHVRGGWNHADYIWRLYILELWLRRYVDA